MVELSVMEQRYQAVMAVVQAGSPATRRAGSRPWRIVHTARRAARTRSQPSSRRSSASCAGSTPAGGRAASSISSPRRGSTRCRLFPASIAVSSATTSSRCAGARGDATSSAAGNEIDRCNCGKWMSWGACCSTTEPISRSSPASTALRIAAAVLCLVGWRTVAPACAPACWP